MLDTARSTISVSSNEPRAVRGVFGVRSHVFDNIARSSCLHAKLLERVTDSPVLNAELREQKLEPARVINHIGDRLFDFMRENRTHLRDNAAFFEAIEFFSVSLGSSFRSALRG